MSKIAKKDSDRAIERITTQVASMGLAEWCETTEALMSTAFKLN